MSTTTNSFQILLEAEQQASALVNEARQCKKTPLNLDLLLTDFLLFFTCTDRAQRLKDARREALEEIEELKKRKNKELIEHEKKVLELELEFF